MPAMSDDDESEEEYDDYDSGQFCRHGSDPEDCEEVCGRCGHKCTMHPIDREEPCTEFDCECPGWVDADDTEPDV